jgi:hypothetical protein
MLVVMATMSPSLAAAQSELVDVVEGVVARAETLVSARIEYRFTAGFSHLDEVVDDAEVHFSFFGDSWITRRPGNGIVRLNHQGKHVEFIPSPQPDGRTFYRAIVQEAQARDKLPPPAPPAFAGTLWYSNTRDYVRERAATVRGAEPITIDGVQTVVVEWDVPREDRGAAFQVMGPALRDGGVLRLYAAPQLGYVLPRIDYLAADGTLSSRYEASDFREVAAGLYYPMHSSSQLYIDTRPGFYVRYEVSSVTLVNESIPPEDFRIALPVGTSVQDTRPGHSASFRVGDPLPAGVDLDDVIVVADVETPWIVAIAVGAAVGLIGLGIVAYWGRRRRRSAAST